MGAKWPDSSQVLGAIELYLKHAYPSGPSHAAERAVQTLRTWAGNFYDAPVFARTPGRCSLRLGNSFYPHMKLVLELEPDNTHYHFRADTHDAHVEVAPDHPEYRAIQQMRQNNARVADEITRAWEAAGLPVAAHVSKS